MINLFGEEYESVPKKKKKRDPKRESWNRRFQKWSNKSSMEEVSAAGVCGWGCICNYCENNSYGNPCVRALNEYLMVTHRTIDYDREDFENVFFHGRQEGRTGNGQHD